MCSSRFFGCQEGCDEGIHVNEWDDATCSLYLLFHSSILDKFFETNVLSVSEEM